MTPARHCLGARRMTWIDARARFAVLLALVVAVVLATGPRSSHAQTPDGAFLDRVIASLSVNERVGQLVMVNFVGDDVSASSDVATLIRDYNVGSVLVTASNGNIVNRGDTAAQLSALTQGLQQRAFDASARNDGADQYFLPSSSPPITRATSSRSRTSRTATPPSPTT